MFVKDLINQKNIILIKFWLIQKLIIIISILSWGVKYFSLKEIVTLLSAFRRKSNSNNLTARSSQISNADENFKKEKTLVLILTPEDIINTENNNAIL